MQRTPPTPPIPPEYRRTRYVAESAGRKPRIALPTSLREAIVPALTVALLVVTPLAGVTAVRARDAEAAVIVSQAQVKSLKAELGAEKEARAAVQKQADGYQGQLALRDKTEAARAIACRDAQTRVENGVTNMIQWLTDTMSSLVTRILLGGRYTQADSDQAYAKGAEVGRLMVAARSACGAASY